MVHTVNVTCAQSYGGNSLGIRFSSHDDDMRGMPFAVSNQVQPLSPGILRAVAANGPFAGNAGMEHRFLRIMCPQRGQVGVFLSGKNPLVDIDFLIRNGQSPNHYIGVDEVIAQSRAEFSVGFQRVGKYGKVSILFEGFNRLADEKFELPALRCRSSRNDFSIKVAVSFSNDFPEVCPEVLITAVSKAIVSTIPFAKSTLI